MRAGLSLFFPVLENLSQNVIRMGYYGRQGVLGGLKGNDQGEVLGHSIIGDSSVVLRYRDNDI